MNDDSLSLYFQEIGGHPVLSRSEELSLAWLVVSGDENAKRRLVESNLRLLLVLPRPYPTHPPAAAWPPPRRSANLGLDAPDVIQGGNLGLIRAVERYDYRRDVKFSTFASWWIRRAIFTALSTKSRLIRLPARLAAHAAKV